MDFRRMRFYHIYKLQCTKVRTRMCLHKSVDVTLGHARYEHIVWHHPHDMQIAVQIVGCSVPVVHV